MRLVPFERETIVSSAPPASVEAVMLSHTQTHHDETAKRRFVGKVTDSGFVVCLKVFKPQNFTPQVDGQVEATSNGCLIFIKYHLFPSTNLFLGFWCILTFVLTFVFLGPAKNYLYGCLSLTACIANYVIALANFDVHLKQTKKALHQVLEKLI